MILQFAKIPPPIGGVTIHVKRLMESLEHEEIDILDYSKEKNLKTIFKKVFKSKLIHIHLGKSKIRFYFIILFKLLGKKVITTFHSKYTFENFYDIQSLKLSNKSILLNEISFISAQKHSENIVKMAAFIAPKTNINTTLQVDTIQTIQSFKDKYQKVFCTNAWNVAINDLGEEVYCGSMLLQTFKELENVALVFSDPMGNYKKFLLDKYGNIPNSIYFVNYNHDFTEIIQLTDAFIRATTTDGDSLSVKEALYLLKPVIASNVVERPKGCIVFNDKNELLDILSNFDTLNLPKIELEEDEVPQQINTLYQELLQS